MLVLGLQGSPRKKGNTSYLLAAFMEACRELGARTQTVHVDREDIKPCKELIVCEKKGYCPIDDTMGRDIYSLLRQAEIVVASSPVFFYGVTAQLKALIDRSQTLWARKYRLKLRDPLSKTRMGVLLAAAATQGKQLFEGLDLTAKYFYDAIDAKYAGSLTYRGVEHTGDMANHPTAGQDAVDLAAKLMTPLQRRKKLLFVSEAGCCAAPMAAALAQFSAGDEVEALGCGLNPQAAIRSTAAEAMAAKGIDMAFLKPLSLDQARAEMQPDVTIAINIDPGRTGITQSQETWDLPCSDRNDPSQVQNLQNDITGKIQQLLDTF